MKIQELLLHEVMEIGFVTTQISSSTWQIDIPLESIKQTSEYYGSTLKFRVDVRADTVDTYKIIEVSFGVPGTKVIELEKIFANVEVFKLFKSIIDIIEKYAADIILLVPNDIEVSIGDKKARIYKSIAQRMKRLGKVGRIEEFNDSENTFQVIFPSDSRAWQMSNSDIQNLLIQFAGNKI